MGIDYNIKAMILNLIYFIASAIVNAYVGTVSKLGGAMPTWFQEGVNSIFAGSTAANNFLPIYAHPEMTGIVHDFGIMNIIGFLVIVSAIAIAVGLIILGFTKLIQVLPWNTQK